MYFGYCVTRYLYKSCVIIVFGSGVSSGLFLTSSILLCYLHLEDKQVSCDWWE